MADVASSLKNWSTTLNSNAPTSATTIGSGLAPNFQQIQATLRNELATRSASVTAAATTDIGVKDEGTVLVTNAAGTIAITSFGTVSAGIKKLVTFVVSGGSLSITHNVTSMILPSSANVTVATGDSLLAESLGSGNWKVHAFYSQGGSVSATQLQSQTYTTFTTGGTSTAYTLTPSPSLTALATGQRFNVIFNATAGATPTLAISGLTAKSIKYYDKTGAKVAVTSTEIVANLNSDVIYDGTDYVVITPARPSFLAYTPVATTSGTSWSFSNIPSWAKEITVSVVAFSTNGTSAPIVQIGDSGGLETSGYVGSTISSGAASAYPASGYPLDNTHGAAFILHGSLTLYLQDPATNTWANTMNIGRSDGAQVYVGGGSKSLSATLDRLTLTTVSGDTGDGGSVSILVK